VTVTCPQCRGHKFSFEDVCSLCSGKGEIDPNSKCICGRPTTEKIDDKPTCGRESCADELKRAQQFNHVSSLAARWNSENWGDYN
jgi:DnaJ-class molecular chaperone